MTVLRNEVRRGTYLDSVALMRISRTLAARHGVEEAGVMIGTEPNKQILRDARVLGPEGEAALPGDLIIAIRAADPAAADAAVAEARQLIDQPRRAAAKASEWRPRTLQAALKELPEANLALISVPGTFAVPEARKALRCGLNVMIFSDNVPLADEVALKREARELGLLVMGPDCGTAIIHGVPLAFANVVPQGDIGIIGASGTGIQEVSCLIADNGGGISHAIGTGGRDLSAEVGGITTLMAIDLLDADPATRHIVIISKPPAEDVAAAVLARVRQSKKSFAICFLGGTDHPMPDNAKATRTLRGAADIALGRELPRYNSRGGDRSGLLVRGLFSGGTLCAEAQVVFLRAGMRVASNAAVRGAVSPLVPDTHVMLDLGDDEYTQGRPHPMIEPEVRVPHLAAALRDDSVGVILLDVVLGYGGHLEPVEAIVRTVVAAGTHGKTVIASVTGTDNDPQNLGRQIRALQAARVLVHTAMSDAALTALSFVGAG